MPTIYEILGVEPSNNFNQLKKAYYKQAVRLHPDKNKGKEAEAGAG